MGRTVVDWSARTGRPPNAKVIHEIDADGFFALLTERLARLPCDSASARADRPADSGCRLRL